MELDTYRLLKIEQQKTEEGLDEPDSIRLRSFFGRNYVQESIR